MTPQARPAFITFVAALCAQRRESYRETSGHAIVKIAGRVR